MTSPLPPSTPEQEHALAILRQIYADARTAHLTTDVDLLLSHTADPLLVVREGTIMYVSRAESFERFRQIFQGAVYQEWDYMELPTIRIADDASIAWAISRARVHRTQQRPDGSVETQGFIYAGIDTFEMRNGSWMKTVNVSTFVEN